MLPALKVAVFTPCSDPLSYHVYATNVVRHLAELGVEVVTFGKDGREAPRCDVVWSPRPGLRGVSRLLRAPAAPLVVTVHDVRGSVLPVRDMARDARTKVRKYLSYHLLRLGWWAYGGRVAATIAVSRFAAAEAARALAIPPERIHVVPHGVDHDAFRAEPGAAAAPAPARPYLLHVAASEPVRKNVERVFAAHASLPREGRPDLVVVAAKGLPGVRVPERRDGIRLIERLVPLPELASLYRGALGLVFPSIHEGFGMPILEAMACGCPVVTSSTTACAETADNAALLVDPRSTEAIASAMRRLSQDPALRARLRDLGRERAQPFTWRRSAEGHARVFALAASGPAGRAGTGAAAAEE